MITGKIKSILIVALVGVAIWFFKSWQHRGDEMTRNKTNFEQRLKEEQADFSEYQFKKDKELEAYLSSTENQLNGLLQKLEDQDIKLRRVEKIVSTRVVLKDTTLNRVVLDSINSILEALQFNGDELSYDVEDKTDCFEFKARVVFADGTVTHEVLSRQAIDTINYVTHFERRKHRWLFGIKTGLFGKKIYKVDLFNNCGYSKTIVLKL